MNDPYKVLGISSTSTDNEINSAYKILLAQYTKDKETGIAALAEEKITELNQAYDDIMDLRKSDFSQHIGNDNSNAAFLEVRQMIQTGNLEQAEAELHRIPDHKNAEWSFLMGTVEYAKGHLNQAFSYFSNAVKLNPNNSEYNAAYNRMISARQGKMPGSEPYHTDTGNLSGCNFCNVCNGLICADCCCECFGGDLIPCC